MYRLTPWLANALDVVFEDGDFIAVNKPVGFHTTPIHR
jgi:23S rRNA-/tRNA-specific pseudouridylate synthase